MLKVKHLFLAAAVTAATAVTIFSAQGSGFDPLKDSAAFMQKVNQRSAEIESIESSFIQEKHLDMFEGAIKSNGYFCYRKPGNVRWEYLKPYNYLIVIRGSDIYLKNDKKTEHFNAKSNKVFSEINKRIMQCLRGDIFNGNNDFDFAFFESRDQYQVVMKPKEKTMKEFMENIKIYFDKTDLSIASLVINEPSGDFTKITFVNKRLNSGIDDAKFTVK